VFGNKEQKLDRLERIVEVLHRYPQGLSQAELAQHLNVSPSTILRDLPFLEMRGVLLQEYGGKMSIFTCRDNM
jgi:DeoR/GlpR family transcriptional regulator of sugar metabolism